ncbi:MAG: GNVR domain-containing protein [Candidatus Zixiibacteriota bacterium]
MGRQLRLRGAAESWADTAAGKNKLATADYHFDLFSSLRVLFRHRRWLALAVLSAGALTAAVTLFIPNKYTATARLLPSGGSDQLSALAGITGLPMLDLAGGLGSKESSSELFPAILSSDRLQNAVLTHRYRFSADGEELEMSLLDYFGERNLDKARLEVSRITSISSEYKTGVITLSVTTKRPELSAAVAQFYIDQLDLFNRTQRVTRATEYEKFLALRLSETRAELGKAENSLAEFQAINRDWAFSSDPDLQKQMLRLKRDLTIKTEIYALVTQQYEVAHSEAQKNTPVVQALDDPAPPLVKSAPKRTLITLAAMVAAGLFGIGLVFLREAFVGSARGADRESFIGLRDDLQSAYPRLTGRMSSVAAPSEKANSIQSAGE